MPKKKNKTKKFSDEPKILSETKVSHPFAFRKLPYHIQHSRPIDYRWVEYDYASHMAQRWGIKSARQWRAFVQSFKPAGMPSNPPRAYPLHWVDWNTFLNNDNAYAGYDPASVKADELLPFSEATAWVQSQQFPTVEAYKEAWDDGMIPKGIPRQPQVRYKEWIGWKYFLGKKIEHRVNAAKDVEPVCALCSTVGYSPNILTLVISSKGATDLRNQLADNPNLHAQKAYYWYHDFGEHVFNLLDSCGTRQSPNSWLFPDLNLVYYELSSVLEPYRPK